MKSKHLISACLIFFIMFIQNNVNGQCIYFTFNNGSQASYNLDSIRNITFTGNVVNLTKIDGTIVTWSMSFIRNYLYSTTVGINEISPIEKLSIYPNPTNDRINVSFELPGKESLSFTIRDSKGLLVHSSPSEMLDAGLHQYSWNINDIKGAGLQSGFYIFSIITEKGLVTKKIILQ
jgi:hypothetical protein